MDPPSRILLLLITNLTPQFPLNNHYLHQLFHPYGEILKILIFERGKTNKVFVEFASIDSAISARQNLNYKTLSQSNARMQIHYSKLTKLNLNVVNNTRGVEYSKMTQDDLYCFGPQSWDISEPLPHSKTDDPAVIGLSRLGLGDFSLKDINDLLEEQEHLDAAENGHTLYVFILYNRDEMAQSVERFLDEDFELEISKHASSSPPKSFGTISPQKSLRGRNPEIDSLLEDDEEVKTSETQKSNCSQLSFTFFSSQPSSLLCVQGLNDKQINSQFLYNLFSNFGNISQIFFNRPKGRALIYYQIMEYATIAKEMLGNLLYFGEQLQISYQQLSETTSSSGEDVLTIPPQQYRFQAGRPLSINFPSCMLHVSNVVPGPLSKLTDHFAKMGQVANAKPLKAEQDKQSCLVQMSTLEDALMVVSKLHNSELCRRRIQISFTQSKI